MSTPCIEQSSPNHPVHCQTRVNGHLRHQAKTNVHCLRPLVLPVPRLALRRQQERPDLAHDAIRGPPNLQAQYLLYGKPVIAIWGWSRRLEDDRTHDTFEAISAHDDVGRELSTIFTGDCSLPWIH